MSNTTSRTYGGRQISVVTTHLLSKSCWFEVTPMPEDRWEVTVMLEEQSFLPALPSLPPEPVLSFDDLKTYGYEVMSDDIPPFRHYWRNADGRSNGSFITAEVAHDDAIEHVIEHHDLSRCDACGKILVSSALGPVKDLSMRVEDGGPLPSGECDCGALAYPLAERA